jgi:hypothetical protein
MQSPKRGAKLAFRACPDCGGTGKKAPLSITIDKLNSTNDD